MKQAWQIVSEVYEAFRGLPVKLAAMNGKTDEWYQSHGREPKTLNPSASGNLSEAEHFMRQCRKFQGGIPGAGQMLANRVHAALSEEFAEESVKTVSQAELHTAVLDEGVDVHKWLINFDMEKATRQEIVKFTTECDELCDSVLAAKGNAQAILKRRGIEQDEARTIVHNAVTNRNTAAAGNGNK